jgi:hypothetical protein
MALVLAGELSRVARVEHRRGAELGVAPAGRLRCTQLIQTGADRSTSCCLADRSGLGAVRNLDDRGQGRG